ncbi:protein suex-1 [Drosophila gunungcola]|uniref:protein suex-1 n=1 Tax=Drosophila gunungcola TaxID=103775 RepID=UPI0022E6D550|nr:protein suex-1 [Drosophila gunungcola]
MQLIFFLPVLVFLGGALAQPVNEDPAPAVTLQDVADLGGQEAKEGERPARWISGGWGGGWNSGWGGGWNSGWGGGWNGGWNKGWSVSYRPWSNSYSNYWW